VLGPPETVSGGRQLSVVAGEQEFQVPTCQAPSWQARVGELVAKLGGQTEPLWPSPVGVSISCSRFVDFALSSDFMRPNEYSGPSLTGRPLPLARSSSFLGSSSAAFWLTVFPEDQQASCSTLGPS